MITFLLITGIVMLALGLVSAHCFHRLTGKQPKLG